MAHVYAQRYIVVQVKVLYRVVRSKRKFSKLRQLRKWAHTFDSNCKSLVSIDLFISGYYMDIWT